MSRELLPFQQYLQPEDYVSKSKKEYGTAYGLLGDNNLDVTPITRFHNGELSREELEMAFVFEERVLKIVLSEMTEEQRINFAFVKIRILEGIKNHTRGGFLEEYERFEEQYKAGEINYTDDELLEINRQILECNVDHWY